MEHAEARGGGGGGGGGEAGSPRAGPALGDPALVLAAATALALALYVWGMWRFDRFAARAIPFAPARPFVGAALPFLLRRRSFAQHLQALYRSGRARPLLGVFHLRAPALLLRDPRLLRRVLVADAAEFPRRCAPPPLARPLHALLDKELDLLPGRRWRRVREALGEALAPKRLEPLLPEVAACARRLARRLELSCATAEAVEVRAPLEAFWSEALGRALLGRRSRALDDDRDALHRHRRALLAAPAPAAAPSPRALLLARCPALAQFLRIQPISPSVEKYFLELADETATDVIQYVSTQKGDIGKSTEMDSEKLIKRTSALWYMISTYLSDVDIRKQDDDNESRSRRDKSEAGAATPMQLSPEVANQGKSRPARKSVTFAPDSEVIVNSDITAPSPPSVARNENSGHQSPILNMPVSSVNATQMDVTNISSIMTVTKPGEEYNSIKGATTSTQKNKNFETEVSANISSKEILVTNDDIIKSNALMEDKSQISDLTIPMVVISAADVQETPVGFTETVNGLHIKNEKQEHSESSVCRVSLPDKSVSVSKETIEAITDSSPISHDNTTGSRRMSPLDADTTDIVQNVVALPSTIPFNLNEKINVDLERKRGVTAGSTHDTNESLKGPEIPKSIEITPCINQEQRNFVETTNVESVIHENFQKVTRETGAGKLQFTQISSESVLVPKEQTTSQEVHKDDQGPITEHETRKETEEYRENLEVRCENKVSAEIPKKEQNAKEKTSEEREKMTNQQPSTPIDSLSAETPTEGETPKAARGGLSAAAERAARAAGAEAAAQLAAQAAEGGRRAALAVALALRLLGCHPEAQARAADEARSAWQLLAGQDGGDAGAARRPFSAAELDAAAPYLDAVLAETLRLFPPSPLLTRGCRGRRRGGALRAQGAGLRVEVALGPRDALWVPVGALQRDARHWGDPDAFRPERFLGDARARYADLALYLPFGLGPRACAGRELVLQYAKLALMAVLARLAVDGVGAKGPREARWRVGLEVEGGVRVSLRPRARANAHAHASHA